MSSINGKKLPETTPFNISGYEQATKSAVVDRKYVREGDVIPQSPNPDQVWLWSGNVLESLPKQYEYLLMERTIRIPMHAKVPETPPGYVYARTRILKTIPAVWECELEKTRKTEVPVPTQAADGFVFFPVNAVSDFFRKSCLTTILSTGG